MKKEERERLTAGMSTSSWVIETDMSRSLLVRLKNLPKEKRIKRVHHTSSRLRRTLCTRLCRKDCGTPARASPGQSCVELSPPQRKICPKLSGPMAKAEF